MSQTSVLHYITTVSLLVRFALNLHQSEKYLHSQGQFLSPNFIVEIKLQSQMGQNMFNCVVRPNVCGDGGHIIRLPEYRPGSVCMHDAENLKNFGKLQLEPLL